MRSPIKPKEAEGERDVPFLSEIKRHVCGPERALNAIFLARRSLASATALAGKRSYQLGGRFFAIGLGARLI